jgi:hypothetical protein
MAMDADRYLTGVPIDLFQPHIILPSQHFEPPGKFAPEHRLMNQIMGSTIGL